MLVMKVWYDPFEKSLTNSELLQVNATLIAGTLIFLSISIVTLDPSASVQIPQIDAEGLPLDLKLMVLDYNVMAADESNRLKIESSTGETLFRIVSTMSIILPLAASAVFSMFGWRFHAAIFLIIGLITIIVVLVLMANLGQSFRQQAKAGAPVGSEELRAKLDQIKSYMAELSNSTSTK